MQIKNPPLRYHGSKWRIADWVIGHFPEHKVYCEPFAGSGAVLFKKPLSRIEVYNDLDGVVVNFFRVLQDPDKSKRLIELVARTPYARDEYDLAFMDECDDEIEMARRLFIKAYMGFGSNAGTRRAQCGFRSNDWTARKSNNLIWYNLPPSLAAATQRLKNVIIENRPALYIIEKQDSLETFFYVDPPYVHSSRTSFARDRSYRFEMTDDDHIELSKRLHAIRGGCIISGYRTDLYDDLYKDWILRQKVTCTQANAKNKYRTECIWINPAVEQINRRSLFNGCT